MTSYRNAALSSFKPLKNKQDTEKSSPQIREGRIFY